MVENLLAIEVLYITMQPKVHEFPSVKIKHSHSSSFLKQNECYEQVLLQVLHYLLAIAVNS